MKVLLASGDLFFASKVRETARQLGADVEQAREGFAAAGLGADVALVDLSATAFDPVAAAAELRAAFPSLRIVGFVRHEEGELAARARAAGCDEVLARGAFAARLPILLARPDRGAS